MASAHTLPIALDRCYRVGFFTVGDPGASGVLSWSNKGHVIFEVVTAGAESRALPSAVGYGVGTRALVVFKTDGGNLTITGSDQTVVLEDAGDVVEFVLSDNDGTKVWRVSSDSRVASTEVGLLQAGVVNGSVAATTDTATLTAAQVLGGFILGTPVSAATYTLPTAALLVAAVNAIGAAAVGQILRFSVHNNGADTDAITLAAGSGATDEGTLTVAQDVTRDFVITLTNVTAASEAYVLYGIG